jgi:hypothetical protein
MNREQLATAGKRPPVTVNVPDVGEIYVRQPSAAEWLGLMEEMMAWRDAAGGKAEGMPPANMVLKMVSIGLANADGSRMYAANEIDKLGELAPDVLQAIYGAVSENLFGGPDPKKD